jgi:hypothetical protein
MMRARFVCAKPFHVLLADFEVEALYNLRRQRRAASQWLCSLDTQWSSDSTMYVRVILCSNLLFRNLHCGDEVRERVRAGLTTQS